MLNLFRKVGATLTRFGQVHTTLWQRTPKQYAPGSHQETPLLAFILFPITSTPRGHTDHISSLSIYWVSSSENNIVVLSIFKNKSRFAECLLAAPIMNVWSRVIDVNLVSWERWTRKGFRVPSAHTVYHRLLLSNWVLLDQTHDTLGLASTLSSTEALFSSGKAATVISSGRGYRSL